MENWIDELFSEELLETAAKRFGCESSQAKKLGDFENYVYEVHKEGVPYILRLTHSSHRSAKEVEAELRWVNYLHENGVNVSLVNDSLDGKLVEVLKAGETFFYVCLFDKAPGKPVGINDPLFDDSLFRKWGRVTGKMHRVTKQYEASEYIRGRWDEDDVLQYAKYLPSHDSIILGKAEENKKGLQALEETPENFGVIHSDIHPGNFFYHEGEIHVFDFDDSMQFFFLSDIAIPLYYSVWWKYRKDSLETRSEFGEAFLTAFLSGYLEESPLEEEWIEHLPAFLSLRDFTLYTVFHKKWDVKHLSQVEEELLTGIRNRLLNDEPIVEIDFKAMLKKARGQVKIADNQAKR
ncbi:phosphotransferase [Rossellomorea aquimaris]|uniref:phosphotransferase enzyme family protein n=1 Tax=Rossellomorea aquimaris TaxID=189382 RepID=UPI001CD633A6|nr:phosphotransferase [Rossellomorea aquimaris]MCA1056573.1 phosphotransferase [Rossellomorea aquimaris]